MSIDMWCVLEYCTKEAAKNGKTTWSLYCDVHQGFPDSAIDANNVTRKTLETAQITALQFANLYQLSSDMWDFYGAKDRTAYGFNTTAINALVRKGYLTIEFVKEWGTDRKVSRHEVTPLGRMTIDIAQGMPRVRAIRKLVSGDYDI